MGDRLIFQLGTNNWQRGGEFAPGSGILHEAHHHAYNALPGLQCYSMYPSRRQRFRDEYVRVFALDHDIPICESVSPVSNYRWHSMSEAEVTAYRQRLTDEVASWMDEIEAKTGDRFELAIAHHAFMNTVVMRDVIRRRAEAGRGGMPLLCFTHGTELKMYANERRGDRPGHHVGAGAGVERDHLDRRVVDLGQRRQRQEAEGDDADQQDRRHQQRGRHRPLDEGLGRAHARGRPPRCPPAGL